MYLGCHWTSTFVLRFFWKFTRTSTRIIHISFDQVCSRYFRHQFFYSQLLILTFVILLVHCPFSLFPQVPLILYLAYVQPVQFPVDPILGSFICPSLLFDTTLATTSYHSIHTFPPHLSSHHPPYGSFKVHLCWYFWCLKWYWEYGRYTFRLLVKRPSSCVCVKKKTRWEKWSTIYRWLSIKKQPKWSSISNIREISQSLTSPPLPCSILLAYTVLLIWISQSPTSPSPVVILPIPVRMMRMVMVVCLWILLLIDQVTWRDVTWLLVSSCSISWRMTWHPMT